VFLASTSTPTASSAASRRATSTRWRPTSTTPRAGWPVSPRRDLPARSASRQRRRGLPELVRRGFPRTSSPTRPRPTTRSWATCPTGLSLAEAAELRAADPRRPTSRGPSERWPPTCEAMLAFRAAAPTCSTTATTCARARWRAAAPTGLSLPGASCRRTSARCSARARAPSAGRRCPATPRTSRHRPRLLELFPEDEALLRWLKLAGERVQFQGLPARICWLGYGERHKAGLLFNELVRTGKVKAPIVIGRDHLDCGSVASPNRETEAMRDGSDAVADWPILNAHDQRRERRELGELPPRRRRRAWATPARGQVIVADGTAAAARRLERVLTVGPRHGRHAPRRRRLRARASRSPG
jgi:urocanate hydratase